MSVQNSQHRPTVKADQVRMYYIGHQRVSILQRKGNMVQVTYHHGYEGRVTRWANIREIQMEIIDL